MRNWNWYSYLGLFLKQRAKSQLLRSIHEVLSLRYHNAWGDPKTPMSYLNGKKPQQFSQAANVSFLQELPNLFKNEVK